MLENITVLEKAVAAAPEKPEKVEETIVNCKTTSLYDLGSLRLARMFNDYEVRKILRSCNIIGG